MISMWFAMEGRDIMIINFKNQAQVDLWVDWAFGEYENTMGMSYGPWTGKMDTINMENEQDREHFENEFCFGEIDFDVEDKI
jgi:hypothetical protein